LGKVLPPRVSGGWAGGGFPALPSIFGPERASRQKLNHKKIAIQMPFPACPIKPHFSARMAPGGEKAPSLGKRIPGKMMGRTFHETGFTPMVHFADWRLAMDADVSQEPAPMDSTTLSMRLMRGKWAVKHVNRQKPPPPPAAGRRA
jgi:hypothetical protein